MPRFSTYTADYTQLETLPWQFWTDEERSYVIKEAYKRLYLTSEQVKPYLDVTRKHYYSQWILPVVLGAGTFIGHRFFSLFKTFSRKSVNQGRIAAFAFWSASTWLWLNFSPYYIQKEKKQQETLELLYNKVGTGMKILNGFLPRTLTSSSIDKQTVSIYNNRHSSLTGTLYAEEDTIPPLLPKNSSVTKWKKISH